MLVVRVVLFEESVMVSALVIGFGLSAALLGLAAARSLPKPKPVPARVRQPRR